MGRFEIPAGGGAGRLRSGLRGVRHGVEPGRGREDAAAHPAAAGPVLGLDQEGSGGGSPSRPPLYRDPLRRGDVRVRSVPRDGTPPGEDPCRADRRRPHRPGGGPAHRRGGGEGARPRAPAGGAAPGSQARERVPLRGRTGEAPRLRARAPARDRGREQRRNTHVHGTGAVDRFIGNRRQRRVRSRRAPPPDVHRPIAPSGRERGARHHRAREGPPHCPARRGHAPYETRGEVPLPGPCPTSRQRRHGPRGVDEGAPRPRTPQDHPAPSPSRRRAPRRWTGRAGSVPHLAAGRTVRTRRPRGGCRLREHHRGSRARRPLGALDHLAAAIESTGGAPPLARARDRACEPRWRGVARGRAHRARGCTSDRDAGVDVADGPKARRHVRGRTARRRAGGRPDPLRGRGAGAGEGEPARPRRSALGPLPQGASRADRGRAEKPGAGGARRDVGPGRIRALLPRAATPRGGEGWRGARRLPARGGDRAGLRPRPWAAVACWRDPIRTGAAHPSPRPCGTWTALPEKERLLIQAWNAALQYRTEEALPYRGDPEEMAGRPGRLVPRRDLDRDPARGLGPGTSAPGARGGARSCAHPDGHPCPASSPSVRRCPLRRPGGSRWSGPGSRASSC